MEKEDSSESVACEEAFVKIEPLKHKKPQAKSADTDNKEHQQVCYNKCGKSKQMPVKYTLMKLQEIVVWRLAI